MKFIKNWAVSFVNSFFPSLAAYRTHDKAIIEYIEKNTLIEMNCKRILYLSPILILFPATALKGLMALNTKLPFIVVLVMTLIMAAATIFTSIKISDALKVRGNGILNKKAYYSKLYDRFWIIWFICLLVIGFTKLNAGMNGAYLYLFQLCMAFFPLVTADKLKKIGIFTFIWAILLGINMLYFGSDAMIIGAMIFIFSNMILVFILSIIIQKLNLSIAVLVAYVREVGFHDQLTNLYNRRGYQFRMSEMVEDEINAGIIMIDIDNFKQYNDTFGHNKGDEVLKAIAHTIKGIANSDTQLVIRYGGEEFAVICLNANADVASIIANSIMKAINKLEMPTADTSVSDYVTVSMGISSMKVTKETAIDEAVAEADKALYEAKEQGRNRIIIH